MWSMAVSAVIYEAHTAQLTKMLIGLASHPVSG
jgi:hypothetical protein